MPKLSHCLTAVIFCFLFLSPQLFAYTEPSQEYTIFFNANAQAEFKERGQALPKTEGLVELPPDADIVAEIILIDERKGFLRGTAIAKILRIIESSDPRIRQDEEISVEFANTNFGPFHRSGNTGIIAAKTGTDIEDRPVLCLYSRRFGDGHIFGDDRSDYWNAKDEDGIACDPSAMKEVKRIKLAAENGDVTAQVSLGILYEKGRGVTRNNAEALKWLQTAAESGDAKALFQLGMKYNRDKNNEDAMKWFKLAAEKGHEAAKFSIEDLQEVESIERAAKEGDAEAQYKLAHKYIADLDYLEAAKWYKLAALQGHTSAADRLGYIYEMGGGGVQVDHMETIKWYLMADNELGLGRQYERLQQYSESLKWYKLAAFQGHTKAMERAGTFYQYGYGVEQNDAEAIKWYLLASFQGSPEAKNTLATMEQQGRGLTVNYAEVERVLGKEDTSWQAKAVLEILKTPREAASLFSDPTAAIP